MGQRRYPGATPFTKDQAKIFYGRNKDIKNLLTMVRVEQKVLLYGKSGLGKTSLLEAGVIPKLPANYIPVSIRFYAKRSDSLSPVEGVLRVLENTLGELTNMPPDALDELETSEKERRTLWYYFKKLQLARALEAEEEPDEPDEDDEDDPEKLEAKLPKTYVLVFDQFEELFSYSKAEINEFKQQFYELTEQNVPERIAELIAPARRKNREKFNRKTLSEIHRKTNVKTVFAIRSDRLSQLNQLSDKITDIQQIFYEIKPLNNDQAKETIVNPAKDPSTDFETSPYTFQKDAVDKIINELTKKDSGSENIETTQLQIVCHRVEEIAEQKRKDHPDKGQVEIQVDDLPNFKNIFLDFYEDSIQKLQETSRDKAKRMIEDELIRSKQRISLDENICKEFITGEELKLLVDTHLLRAERNSFGRFSFELSHDTLVEPILESRKKYQDELEKKRLEEKRQEELLKLRQKQALEKKKQDEEIKRIKAEQERKEKERIRKLRQQRLVTGIVTFFLLISLGLGYWGFKNFCNASEQRDIALVKEHEANVNLINFKNSQYEEYFGNGNDEMNDAAYDQAITNFELAKRWIHADITIPVTDTGRDCNIVGMIFQNLDGITGQQSASQNSKDRDPPDIYDNFVITKKYYDSIDSEIEAIQKRKEKFKGNNFTLRDDSINMLERIKLDYENELLALCDNFTIAKPDRNSTENELTAEAKTDSCKKINSMNGSLKSKALCAGCSRLIQINDSINICLEKKERQKEYYALLAEGSKLRDIKQFELALKKYQEAYEIDSRPQAAKNGFIRTKNMAESHYKQLIRIADGMTNEENKKSLERKLRNIEAMKIDR